GNPQKFFHQYAIADRNGRIVAGYPYPAEEILDGQQRPKSWAFRDWFNGLGDQRDQEGTFEPIRKPYISQPYVSRVPGRSDLAVNVSVPLFDEEGGRVLGVLTGQIVVNDLHTWLEGVIPDGFVVLLNERGHCLYHQDRQSIRPAFDQGPIDWRQRCE